MRMRGCVGARASTGCTGGVVHVVSCLRVVSCFGALAHAHLRPTSALVPLGLPLRVRTRPPPHAVWARASCGSTCPVPACSLLCVWVVGNGKYEPAYLCWDPPPPTYLGTPPSPHDLTPPTQLVRVTPAALGSLLTCLALSGGGGGDGGRGGGRGGGGGSGGGGRMSAAERLAAGVRCVCVCGGGGYIHD